MRPAPPSRTIQAAIAAVFLSFAGFAAPAASPQAALAEGNRLFDRDELEPALQAYAGGYSGEGSLLDATLAYNAGTCALRLGRLAEALLWFRRAETAAPGDPWVRDNLALARHALGTPPEEAGPSAWRAGGPWMQAAGAVLAWMTLVLVALSRRPSRRLLAALGLLACAAFAAGVLLDRFGSRAAVLLSACPGGLPAGSEVRVRPAEEEGWLVAGSPEVRCPATAVGLVEPWGLGW